MKKLLLATYIFFCTGGTYAQERQNTVIAEIDFNRPTVAFQSRADTVRVSFLYNYKSEPRTNPHRYCEGYAVIRQKDTLYLNNRKEAFSNNVEMFIVEFDYPVVKKKNKKANQFIPRNEQDTIPDIKSRYNRNIKTESIFNGSNFEYISYTAYVTNNGKRMFHIEKRGDTATISDIGADSLFSKCRYIKVEGKLFEVKPVNK